MDGEAGKTSKIVARDGEVWRVAYNLNGRKRSLEFKADFRWGIFQEVYLSELKAAKEAGSSMEKALDARAGRKEKAPEKEAEEEAVSVTKRQELERLNARGLKALLKEQGLDTKGTKASLLERLLAA